MVTRFNISNRFIDIPKIDDIYFNYDYIGALGNTQINAKYNAGNGGFSLRNVKSCIKYCEKHRNLLVSQISPGNEDIFFAVIHLTIHRLIHFYIVCFLLKEYLLIIQLVFIKFIFIMT